MKRSKNWGFTIIEVIVVITIISILMVMAIPNMSTILESNQATEQSHNFISAIQLGISESEKNNITTTLCAKNESSNTCATVSGSPNLDTWRHGWLLFTDDNESGDYESGQDKILKVQVNGSNKINISATSSSVKFSSGGVITEGNGDYYFTPSTCQNNGTK